MSNEDINKDTRTVHAEYIDAEGNVHREYKDAQGNIYTEYKDAQGTLHTYKNGYIDGYLAEDRLRNEFVAREKYNGLLLGLLIVCLGGIVFATIYYLTRPEPEPVPVVNVPIPVSTPTPTPTPTPDVTVVEKPTVTIVPVSQPQSGDNSTSSSGSSAPETSSTPPAESPAPTSSQPASSPATSAEPSSSSTQPKTDSELKAEILEQLQDYLPDNQLIVEVQDAAVTISGTVPSSDKLQQISTILEPIEGIKETTIEATVAE